MGQKRTAKLSRFLHELEQALELAESFSRKRTPIEPARAALVTATVGAICGARRQLELVQAGLLEQPADVIERADAVITEVNAPTILAAHRSAATDGSTQTVTAGQVKSGLEFTGAVLEKINEYIPDGPWKGAVTNLGQVIGIVGQLIEDGGSEIERIEQKLEALQGGLLGPGFPDGPISGPVLPDGASPLRDEVQEIEDKIEHFFELVTGNPVPRNDDGSIADAPDRAELPQLPGSLAWMAWQLEYKLDQAFGRLTGEDYQRNAEGWVIDHPRPTPDKSIEGQIDAICKKVMKLAELLGKTLYGVEWDVRPDRPPGGTVAPGQRPVNAVPPRSVKDELHDLEAMLVEVLRLLRIIIRILRWWPPPVPPIPPEEPPDIVLFNEVKRIFVYDEGVFQAAGAGDARTIVVRTAAFDLAGWIDLTDLAAGDRFTVEVWVNLPGPLKRLYRKRTFNGATDAGLKSLADVVGPQWLVGNALDIVLRQEASAAGFVPALSVAYQFVVESQAV